MEDLFLTQRDKVEVINKIVEVKVELTNNINSVRVELIDRINHVEKSVMRAIYIIGLVQFLAIVASVLAIVNFMLK